MRDVGGVFAIIFLVSWVTGATLWVIAAAIGWPGLALITGGAFFAATAAAIIEYLTSERSDDQ